MSAARLDVVRNGIDPEIPAASRAAAADVRADLGIDPQAPLVVAVGRLSPEKGMDLLVAAFARVAADRPQARLVVVGDGAGRAALETQSDRLGVADRVVFAGWRPDPYPYLLAADLFACPSRLEGLGMSVLEAQVAGTPVVAFRVGGVPEIVTHAETGWLVTPASVADLAAGVAHALDHPAEMAGMAERGRRRVVRDWSLAGMARTYHDVYGEAVARTGPANPVSGASP
jgi:glycosyltransferase involved in cell wall biosynthesis